MSAKVDAGMYKDRFAFEADFALMISNAKQYNVAGSYAHNEAIAMETLFEKRKLSTPHGAPVIKADCLIPDWSRINKTLEVANKASHLAAASAEDAFVASAKAMSPPPVAAAPTPSRAEGPSTSTRPTIKFKPSVAKIPDAPKSASKPRTRKPKVIDVPPPPYIDDGSHDLLQEVIAIEKETKEKRRRSTSERDLLPEKRKRPSPEDDDDDDILALAAPISSKKKNSGLSAASTMDALEHVLENGTALNDSPPPLDGPLDGPVEVPAAQPSTLHISLKGKEKEVVLPPSRSASKPSKSPSTQATPLNEKKCRDVLKALLKLPEAFIFAQPVDPEKDGCPT